MSKIFTFLVIGLLCATLAFAQASSSAPSPQQPSASSSGQSASGTQAQPQSSGTQAQPAQPADQKAQSDRDRAKSDADAAAASRAEADKNAAQSDASKQAADQNAAAANQNAQQAASPRGIPWGWIVLGIVVVAVILALIGRGTDRVESTTRVETIDRDRDVIVRDRRDDDIRRVG